MRAQRRLRHRRIVELATNDNLEERVRNGEFRQDLFYRINVVSITQPALRERIGDIPLLVDHSLAEFNEQTGQQVRGFDDQAMLLLQRYQWPGNVRELFNVVERAVVLSKSDVISAVDLPESLQQAPREAQPLAGRLRGGNLKSALANPEALEFFRDRPELA